MTDKLRDRLKAMNPEPLDDPSVEELATVFSVIDARRSAMRVDEASDAADEVVRPRLRFRPAIAFAGMALLLIAVVGISAIVFGGSDAPVADTPATDLGEVADTSEVSSTESSASTTLPSASTTLAPSLATDAWVRVGEDVFGGALGLFDITAYNGGFAAVGWTALEGPAVGAVFLSDDGVTWRQVARDAPALTSSLTLLYNLTDADAGLVATGIGCEPSADPCAMSGAPWISEDGTEWTRVPHDAENFGDLGTQMTGIEDVIATADGTLVAVGATDSWTFDEDPNLDRVETTPTVWMSTDGVVWEKVWEGEGFELAAPIWDRVHTSPMHAVAQDPDGAFVAVGKTFSADGTPKAAAWTSDDGLVWEPVVAFAPTFGEDTTMTDIAWGNEGFVVVGTEGGDTPAIWRSTGASYWTRISMFLQPFDGTGSLSAVNTVDGGYVIAGPHPYLDQSGGALTAWTSTDGERWDRVHRGDPGTVAALVASNESTVIAGAAPVNDEWQGSVWVGPPLDPLNPAPDPGSGVPEPTQEEIPDRIEALPMGLSCDELAAAGLSYEAAVSYLARYDELEDLDLARDEPLCSTTYGSDEVAAVFGEDDGAAVRFSPWRDGFIGDGPAADTGLVCESVWVEFEVGSMNTEPADPEVAVSLIDNFFCEDGSGSLAIIHHAYNGDWGDTWQGVWRIESTTGAYELLRGGGAFGSSGGPITYVGRLWNLERTSG